MRHTPRPSRITPLLGLLALLSLSPLLPGLPGPAHASCQTARCQQDYRLNARDREAEARATLAEDPADPRTVRKLLGLLRHKSYRERAIADHRMTYSWEPPPSPAALDGLEERIAADRRTWREVLARVEADDPEAWCDHARSLEAPEERLTALRDRLAQERSAEREAPATEAELTACLARELAAQDRRDEAVDHLRSFLDHHPEPAAYQELRRLSDDATGRQLLREQAARRPDDFDAQAALLRWLLRRDACDEDVERGRVLATRLLETELAPIDHEDVCRALEEHLPDDSRQCLLRLLRSRYPDADPRILESVRDRAWQSLAFQAIHARDWPRFEWVLGRIPREKLARLWNQAVGFTEGDFCPQFLAAYERGLPPDTGATGATGAAGEAPVEHAVRDLAYALRTCGEDQEARELLQGAGLLRPDGSDPRRLEWIERRRDHAHAHGPDAFPTRSSLHTAARTADDAVIAALERWAAEEPEAVHPWLYLAAIHEEAGRTEETFTSWQAALARRPDDLDLRVALGAVALRHERHDLVREVARRLRSDPAATARHQAEADYLLGRVARREGRWDEASDRLEQYFLRRLRYTRCARVEPCDQGLVAHLYEVGDRERLVAYIERALDAREAYESPLAGVDPGDDQPRQHSLSPEQIERIDRAAKARLEASERYPDPDAVRIVCTSPRLLDHLERRLAAHPDDPDLQRRLDTARGRPVCSPDQLPAPEELFPDDQLLGLSWQLREVS